MTDILLADDDEELCEMLSEYLHAEGFSVASVHDGEAAVEHACSGNYSLMVLDVMMPKLNGFDVLRAIRPQSKLPVIILTARGDDVDSVVGLELGADDYLAKPGNPRVLVARIHAIMRRINAPTAQTETHSDSLVLNDLEIHFGRREVYADATLIDLTSTEFSILEVLATSAGQIVTKNDLSERALGRTLGRWDRSIDMHISNLRRKLGPFAQGGERIKTVRGKGYQYVKE